MVELLIAAILRVIAIHRRNFLAGIASAGLAATHAPAAHAKASMYRDLTLQPGSVRAWPNVPLRTDTTYSTRHHPRWGEAHRALANFVADGGRATVHSSSSSAPWYVARHLDDMVTLRDTSLNPARNAGVYRIRCPQGATPAAHTHHMTIIDSKSNIMWSGYECKVDGSHGNPVRANSVIEYFLGRFDALSGDLDAPFLNTKQANRYQWGLLEGRLWETELAGGARFQHVLRAVMSCDVACSVGPAADIGQPPFCHETDFYALTPGNSSYYTGKVPFGMRLAIPQTFDVGSFRIDGRELNANQMGVALALRDYGMVTRDTTGKIGGRSQIALNFEPAVARFNPQFIRDIDAVMPVLVPYLAIVTNSSTTYPFAGQGGPIAPGPLPFGPADL